MKYDVVVMRGNPFTCISISSSRYNYNSYIGREVAYVLRRFLARDYELWLSNITGEISTYIFRRPY